jgi:hypothetical protein
VTGRRSGRDEAGAGELDSSERTVDAEAAGTPAGEDEMLLAA